MSAYATDTGVQSWGRVLRAPHRVAEPHYRDELAGLLDRTATGGASVLPTGLRRSYGDSGLNPDNCLIDLSHLDRLIAFDPGTGVLHAEAGVSIAAILDFALPRGFFVPVTPGTKFVTLGGAVANDVHGKNHPRNGSFGRWVRRIGLVRSDRSYVSLTPDDPTGLFAATVGGLGLTGIIADVAVQLLPVPGARMATETIPFGHVGDYFDLIAQSTATHEHNVAWIDCLATGNRLGRGIFTRANHAPGDPAPTRRSKLALPFDFPAGTLNRLSIAAFNELYLLAGRMGRGRHTTGIDRFFYPLDRIGGWNRMYGAPGLFQYQSVVPPGVARGATEAMLRAISRAGEGSFLVVLKNFGSHVSPGLLSFPREGTTLALDFPNRGESTLKLLSTLDDIVREAGGRLYPAKDGRLPPDMFRLGYPALERFAGHVDPAISSSFWRRMTNG